MVMSCCRLDEKVDGTAQKAVKRMSFVGTPEYMAPEMVSGIGHNSSVDWWGLGVLMFEMLVGRTPFRGASLKETFDLIRESALVFPIDPEISAEGRDLIQRLLPKDPTQRLGMAGGAAEIKAHAFFSEVDWQSVQSRSRASNLSIFFFIQA